MEYNYTFFEQDASFTYLSPFGPRVQRETEAHGFSIDIDSSNNIDMNSLKGYGAFCDIKKCKTLEQLFEYIENNKGYVVENEYEETKYTRLECLLELQQIIIQNVKEKIKTGYAPECPLYSGLKWQPA